MAPSGRGNTVNRRPRLLTKVRDVEERKRMDVRIIDPRVNVFEKINRQQVHRTRERGGAPGYIDRYYYYCYNGYGRTLSNLIFFFFNATSRVLAISFVRTRIERTFRSVKHIIGYLQTQKFRRKCLAKILK